MNNYVVPTQSTGLIASTGLATWADFCIFSTEGAMDFLITPSLIHNSNQWFFISTNDYLWQLFTLHNYQWFLIATNNYLLQPIILRGNQWFVRSQPTIVRGAKSWEGNFVIRYQTSIQAQAQVNFAWRVVCVAASIEKPRQILRQTYRGISLEDWIRLRSDLEQYCSLSKELVSQPL